MVKLGNFYSYLWFRTDGTPYYAGKGRKNRAFHKHGRGLNPPDKSRILVFPMLSEKEAFESEKELIQLFGRVDIGTGCLRNLTDGGEGVVGLPARTRQKIKISLMGRSVSDSARHKMSQSHLGIRLSDSHIRAQKNGRLKGQICLLTYKICPVCSQSFIYNFYCKKYCSRDCFLEMRRQQKREAYHSKVFFGMLKIRPCGERGTRGGDKRAVDSCRQVKTASREEIPTQK
jgi:hypothetical protein